MNLFLAVLVNEPPANPVRNLRPILSPVNVPWPPWVWLLIGLGVLLLLIVIMMILRSMGRHRGIDVYPGPQLAIDALNALASRISKLKPYDFSIAVSDILRAYISRQFRLRATQQTSPEFLASISTHRDFTPEDRQLLGKFLERCDQIKFAGDDGTEEDSKELLAAALAFVHGGHNSEG